ncbi:MAG: uracil-DNA glycosylase [Acidobacteriota bacterium]|jgi:uracil-DNA glycosylase family 4|nr:MAG: hypothetical protein DIU54_05735 [Acidobacteriota bacterium]
MNDRSSRQQLADHLRVYAKELGVAGVSTDPAWRQRAAGPPASHETEPAAATASDPSAKRAPADVTAVASPADALASLRAEIGDCTRCALHALGRTQVVFGVGNPDADLMFVGEAPGGDEDRLGEPFVGRAGQLLTRIIEAIGMRREDVYIANVIKCRPPNNRNPEPAEVQTCSPFLRRQIEIVRPKVMVALGTFAAQTLLGTDAPISRLRGRVHDLPNGIRLIPTFHPAYLLRSPERKRDVWEDMKIVRDLLAESG